MEDRELLGLAAKAAGIKIDKSSSNGGGHGNTGFDIMGNAVLDWHNGKIWNPLANDADAFRLSVNLQISLLSNIIRYEASTISLTLAGIFIKEDMLNQSPDVAARRAIVRAAAELGRLRS